MGVDLGQASDFTAIAVVERTEEKGEWDAATWAWKKRAGLSLRFLQRMALGTPYPEVVARVAEVVESDKLTGRCHLLVDATGVGRPVVDLLRQRAPKCWLTPVVVTRGERESGGEGGYWRTPKRDLIVGLQVLVQTGDFKIAAGLPYAAALAKEMAEMRVKSTGAGREQFGAAGQGAHDDLVFAAALACWGARKYHGPGVTGEQGWMQHGRLF